MLHEDAQTWEPFLIANLYDENFNRLPEVKADLDRALAPVLAPEYRQFWFKPV
jgi:hypothetical protein